MNDTIIAKYKHFTKDNRASTKCLVKQQRGPREDARITHARPTITAGVWLSYERIKKYVGVKLKPVTRAAIGFQTGYHHVKCREQK